MVPVTVGHKVVNTIAYLDENGNSMLTTPTPVSPPAWTDSGSQGAPPVDSLSVSTDGNTATVSALAAGKDNLAVAVVVGAQTFNATVEIDVSPAPQVLTSIAITSVVQ